MSLVACVLCVGVLVARGRMLSELIALLLFQTDAEEIICAA